MRFSTLLPLASAIAVGGISQVAAQATVNTTYVGELVGALTQANLTTLISVAQLALNSTSGAALFAGLQGSNKTLFAPSDSAFSNISTDGLTGDDVATLLSYHVLNASVTNITATAPKHELVRSFYNTGMLPGNLTEPVVLSSMGGNMSFIAEAATNVSIVGGPYAVANLQVYIIDQVLTLPGSLSDIAMEFVPSIAGVIQSAGLLDTLANTTGVTIFAPNDAAVSAIASTLGTLNTSVVTTVLSNHVILGQVVYSTQLTSSNYTSAGGEKFMFTSNSSGTYVMSGTASAKIVQSDVLLENGVVHVIDQVLVNTGSNSTAAAAAASSYSSEAAAAATATTGSAVIGAATTTASGTGSAASGTATGGTSGALPAISVNYGVLGGLAMAAMGVLGGVLVL